MHQRCSAFMELYEQPLMYRFRRQSLKSFLCLMAITMPLQVLPANPCQCAESRNSSLQSPLNSEAVRQQYAYCSTKQASCCTSPSDAGTRHGGCSCQQTANASTCNCGQDCQCKLQAPEPATPALPPISSTHPGSDLLESLADCCRVSIDTVYDGHSQGQHPSSSQACIAPANLDLCATFCRFLL